MQLWPPSRWFERHSSRPPPPEQVAATAAYDRALARLRAATADIRSNVAAPSLGELDRRVQNTDDLMRQAFRRSFTSDPTIK